jgi:hypothetical protein
MGKMPKQRKLLDVIVSRAGPGTLHRTLSGVSA